MSDEEILRAIRLRLPARDKAMGIVYDRNYEVVFKLVLSKGGTAEDAQDVMQDTGLAFYQAAAKGLFKGRSAIDTYFYSIARNKASMLFRKRQQNRKLVNDPEFSRALDADTVFELAVHHQPLSNVLRPLAPDCFDMLMDVFAHDKPYRLIAEERGLASASVVGVSLHRCKSKFSKLLTRDPRVIGRVMDVFEGGDLYWRHIFKRNPDLELIHRFSTGKCTDDERQLVELRKREEPPFRWLFRFYRRYY